MSAIREAAGEKKRVRPELVRFFKQWKNKPRCFWGVFCLFLLRLNEAHFKTNKNTFI